MREAFTLLLLAITVALAMALYSYSPTDPSFNHATDRHAENMMGLFGAYVADLLFQFIGYAAALLLPMLSLWSIRMVYDRASITGHWRAFFWLPAAIALAALFHLHLASGILGIATLPAGAGGAIGMLIGETLRLPLGFWGLSIMLLALSLSCLMIATAFSTAYHLRQLSALLRRTRTAYKHAIEWSQCRLQRRRERIEHRERQRKERQAHIQTVLDQSQEIQLSHIFKDMAQVSRTVKSPPSPTLPEKEIDPAAIDHILDQVARHLPKAQPVVEPQAITPDVPDLLAELGDMGMDEIPDALLTPSHDESTEQEVLASLDLNTLELPVELLKPTADMKENNGTAKVEKPKEKAPLTTKKIKPFIMPTLNVFHPSNPSEESYTKEELAAWGTLLEEKLRDYKVEGLVQAVKPGPVVIQFEYQPAPGTKVSRIMGLQNDLARSIAAVSLRVAGNIPGKHVIGIEIPNKKRQMVSLHQVLASDAFNVDDKLLPMALGVDIAGRPVVVDLANMPHLLVAGTTGSGKSVSINTMICSLLMKHTPETLRMIMVDPKMLELSMYNGIPHLLVPVVTNPKKAAHALDWAVLEMERRYQCMSDAKVRNLSGYNQRAIETSAMETLPLIVIVIDELADLMMVAGKDVEQSICRLAQKARAAGLHLILATQRPSVDVITGLIKANLPSRLAFRVSSRIDARTILDQMGAEQLLGQGDALLMTGGCNMSRVHGAFVSDAEVQALTEYLKSQGEPAYQEEVLQAQAGRGDDENEEHKRDAKYDEAVALVLEKGQCSVSMIQRNMRVGYNRASRIVDSMEKEGVVSVAGTGGIRQLLTAIRSEKK
ncbi:MAG: DNA translocase FtsK 4TM domain-containing protein [Mariprofundaceae bacterium]|nr:DNA translocase FtsK 4TM domain-containing protein [Mariprofundaceae bacterium]